MHRKLAFLVAAASLFALEPLTHRLGPVGSAVVLVWLGVVCAAAASGGVYALAVASGALGAFGAGVLAPISPAAAGAVLVASAFVERTTRVRARTARGVHVALALVGGSLAGSLSTAFAGQGVAVVLVAVVVAAVLAALPLLVDADDALAHALDLAAAQVSEPARTSLNEGAELRRQAADVPLDRDATSRAQKTWQSLLRLAEARVRLERSRPAVMVRVALEGSGPKKLEAAASPPAGEGKAVDAEASEASTSSDAGSGVAADAVAPERAVQAPRVGSSADAVVAMIDQRLAEHVAVLAKAYTAVDAVRAAAVGLDDTALKNIESLGDALDEESRAMVEVKASSSG